jgi:hypothetical protein
MVVPLAARYVAGVVGVVLVVTSASSVIGTLIVPRPVGSWLTKRVDWLVDKVFVLVTMPVRDFRRRDRILAAQAATLLLAQILAWLAMFFVGFSLGQVSGRSARTWPTAGFSRPSSTSLRSPGSSP